MLSTTARQKLKATAAFTAVLTAIVILVAFLYLIRPIIDPDFFWHLKTGEWIWDHKALPLQDPFAASSPPPPTARQSFVLTASWLSDLLYIGFFKAGGLTGIIVLRFIIVALALFAVMRRLPGDKLVSLGLVIILTVAILGSYPIERPQVFSFLFFALLLFLLEKILRDTSVSVDGHSAGGNAWLSGARIRKNLPVLLLPVLMLVWGNAHGGFAAGLAAILLYLLGEGVKFLSPALRPARREAYGKLLVAGVAGIACSLINPHGLHGLMEMISQPELIIAGNPEYFSVAQEFSESLYRDPGIFLYFCIMLFVVVALLVNRKALNLTHILLIAGCGYVSFMHIRYIAFFLIVSFPVIATAFLKAEFRKWGRILVLGVAMIVVVYIAGNEVSNVRNLETQNWIDEYEYPVKAADFVIANGLKGNVFNTFRWGGYLIWRLSPESRVFIDGRILDPTINYDWLTVTIAYENGRMQVWKAVLEKYAVNYMIIAYSERQLLEALAKDKDWALVFSQDGAFVIVKRSPENAALIHRYAGT